MVWTAFSVGLLLGMLLGLAVTAAAMWRQESRR